MLSALLGMTIGVASVVGVHLLSAQIAWRVDQQTQPVGDVDLYVQRAGLTDDDYFNLRARWRAGELPRVAALFPLLEGQLTVSEETYLLVGTDPLAAGSLRLSSDPGVKGADRGTYRGRALDGIATFLAEDSVYLPDALRNRWTAEPERITLSGQSVRVLDGSAPDRVILADLPTARAILSGAASGSLSGEASLSEDPAPRFRLSRIGVRLARAPERADIGRLIGQFMRDLFPGALAEPAAEVLRTLDESWQQTPAANQDPTQQLLRSVLFNVAALSVLALVVAWLLTYQVACHALGRREQMFARLQSLGVARRGLRRLTQVEGIALGICATGLGVVLGVLLANLLLGVAADQPFRLALGLTGFVWLKALVSGVGVAAISYWLAAEQALFKVRAAADSNATDRRVNASAGHRWRLAFAVLLAAAFCWGLWGGGLVGAFLCIVIAALSLIIYLPAIVQALWRRTLRLATRPTNSTLKILGLRQVLAGRELRLGVSALALALATALGISVMVDSFRMAFVGMLDHRLADDLVLQVRSEQDRTALQERLRPYIEAGFWRGVAPIALQGVSGRVEYSDDHAQLLARFALQKNRGAGVGSESRNAVFMNESFAQLKGISIGHSIEVGGARSNQTAYVAGIFTDFGEVRPRLLAERDLVNEVQGTSLLDEFYIRTDNARAVRQILTEWPDLSRPLIRDQVQIRKRSIEIFEQTFAITRALTWLALLVAAVGLANALAANGLQQRGVDRQLQVLGLAESEHRRLRLSRTAYVTGASVALALPLGLVIAALLCYVVNPRAFGWSFEMQLTAAGIGWPLLGGALGGLFAAALGDWIARRQSAGGGLPELIHRGAS